LALLPGKSLGSLAAAQLILLSLKELLHCRKENVMQEIGDSFQSKDGNLNQMNKVYG
jgi:hypothetical protein